MLGMRRSCDPCGRKKRKCDGGNPCRRCVRTKDCCTYSKRKWHFPQPQKNQHVGQKQKECQLKWSGNDGMQSTKVQMQSRSGHVVRCGMLSLKRCRMSPSPATGLVGMPENAFLSDFFKCLSFVPLTTRSDVREAMVKLLMLPATRQCSSVFNGAGTEEIVLGPSRDSATSNSDHHLMDPSACTFWCAVAVGVLVKGGPMEVVETYFMLAKNGLANSDRVDVEVAKAWPILAYVHLLCGDTDMFHTYMARSESFLNASIEQGLADTLPVGFAEMVGHRTCVKFYSGDVSMTEVKSFCAQEHAPPQLNDTTTEFELYRYVKRSLTIFEQAVYEKAYSHIFSAEGQQPLQHLRGARLGDEGARAVPQLRGASPEVLDTVVGALRQHCQFERLEDAMDRPIIRSGIGAIVVNGTLFLKKALEGDLHGTLACIGRCAEVLERFPGLCRFVKMSHTVHVIVTALVAIESGRARDLYNILRTAYNPNRQPGTPPLPPLEEWQGILHCCDNFYCRTMEHVVLSGEISVFAVRPSTHETEGKPSAELDRISGHVSSTRIKEEEGTISSPYWGSMVGSVQPGPCQAQTSSPVVRSALTPTASITSPACLFHPNCERGAEPNADLGDDNVVTSDAGHESGVFIRSPDTLSDFSEWHGINDTEKEEDGLAAEDWLHAADTLHAVTR